MVANILPADPTPPSTLGVKKVKNQFFFSEQCHVAYQMKENYKCSNMIAIILHADPPQTLEVGQNSTFLEHGHDAISN